MDIRYSTGPQDVKRYTTEELRREFLIENLYVPDQVRAVYSHVDRMVVLGIHPVTKALPIDQGIDVWASFGTRFFLERREAGVFNLGGPGSITVDGQSYALGFEDCLYITMGAKEVTFSSADPANPARFYLVSAPAHRSCKTTFLSMADAAKKPLGAAETSNKRVINQFIHPDVLETCQLSMGLTKLEPGSVWNTMPAHTHDRRVEAYYYFNVPEGNRICHLMGEPKENRLIWMNPEQAVISPEWSIHCAAGTSNYMFIWGMGGENLDYTDQDRFPYTEMR